MGTLQINTIRYNKLGDFLASHDVIMQRVHQTFSKTPVWGVLIVTHNIFRIHYGDNILKVYFNTISRMKHNEIIMYFFRCTKSCFVREIV